ncbi:MAG: metal ABC transporter substrate-binding protein [Hespellia sp.]|nr:metal ABC transporter substrate-binding protein [Hespellia sp.]
MTKKQLRSIFVLPLLLFSLSALVGGCGSSKVEKDSDKISVVATIFPQYDFTRAIAGDNAEITMLLKPGSESHSYEPTPQDIITIQKCDVFLYVGGENDAWVEEILSSMDTSNMQVIALTDCVDTVEEEVVEGMQESHEDEAETVDDVSGQKAEAQRGEIDEHVWTSPKNAQKIVDKISRALCTADPEHASDYEANTSEYQEELAKLDMQFRHVTDSAERREIIFGDRFPLRYFAEEYGLTYYAAFPGCASDTEPSAATIAFLIDKVKEDKIPIVFKIELSNGNMAEAIADATGAREETFYSCHNISADDWNNGETYLSLMEKNVETLKDALN